MSSPLAVKIAGLKLPNPTMLAAGILGLSSASLLEVAKNGAGAIVTKSVGLKPRVGFANPAVVQTSCGWLNAIGLANPGAKDFAEEIGALKNSGLTVPLVASVFGFSSQEFAKAGSILARGGADAVELNASCPHVEKTGSEIGQDPSLVAEVVKKVKSAVSKPVFVKLTPNVADIAEIAKIAVKAGADGVTAINTVRAMAIDVETGRPILSNRIGGLSGSAVKPIAVRCVYEIFEAVDVPIIGCGGVNTWRDAVEFMLAGASAVQVGTAVATEGIDVFKSLTKGLESYVRKKGFRSVNEIVGLSHRR
jgi:dihydroorotate dehydrogenase (NAD+) catalytic subunit